MHYLLILCLTSLVLAADAVHPVPVHYEALQKRNPGFDKKFPSAHSLRDMVASSEQMQWTPHTLILNAAAQERQEHEQQLNSARDELFQLLNKMHPSEARKFFKIPQLRGILSHVCLFVPLRTPFTDGSIGHMEICRDGAT